MKKEIYIARIMWLLTGVKESVMVQVGGNPNDSLDKDIFFWFSEMEETKKYQAVDGKEFTVLSIAKIVEPKEKSTPPPEKFYFLFGEDACDILDNEGEEELLKCVKMEDVCFAISMFTIGDSPLDIMKDASGWSDYTYLSKELYDKLSKI